MSLYTGRVLAMIWISRTVDYVTSHILSVVARSRTDSEQVDKLYTYEVSEVSTVCTM